jgi:hypothetical protein
MTSCDDLSGVISLSALYSALYPSRAMYSSMFSGSILPVLESTRRTCLL